MWTMTCQVPLPVSRETHPRERLSRQRRPGTPCGRSEQWVAAHRSRSTRRRLGSSSAVRSKTVNDRCRTAACDRALRPALAQSFRRPTVTGTRRRITHDQLASPTKEPHRATPPSWDGGPNRPSRHGVEPIPKLLIPTCVLGPAVNHLHPIAHAQLLHRPAEKGRPAIPSVQQHPGGIRIVQRQDQAWHPARQLRGPDSDRPTGPLRSPNPRACSMNSSGAAGPRCPSARDAASTRRSGSVTSARSAVTREDHDAAIRVFALGDGMDAVDLVHRVVHHLAIRPRPSAPTPGPHPLSTTFPAARRVNSESAALRRSR